MPTRRVSSLPFLSVVLALAGILVWPARANAQYHHSHGYWYPHISVGVGFGFGYPGLYFNGFWGPWGGPWAPYGAWGPYWGGYAYGPHFPGPYGPYGYGYYPPDVYMGSIKFSAKPKDAEVYVDGAHAGIVDDFDGSFQSLKLSPGNHEIVVYREGFHSFRQYMYVDPDSDRKMRFEMQALGPGEAQEPRPVPPPPKQNLQRDRGPDAPPSKGRRPQRPQPNYDPQQYYEPAPQQQQKAPQQGQFGTLNIRVVPGDAEIYVDGDRWAVPPDTQRLTLQLSPGRHNLEVRKSGFSTYSEEVVIRQGGTVTLNVSLR